mgnify:CR=1 FL=1
MALPNAALVTPPTVRRQPRAMWLGYMGALAAVTLPLEKAVGPLVVNLGLIATAALTFHLGVRWLVAGRDFDPLGRAGRLIVIAGMAVIVLGLKRGYAPTEGTAILLTGTGIAVGRHVIRRQVDRASLARAAYRLAVALGVLSVAEFAVRRPIFAITNLVGGSSWIQDTSLRDGTGYASRATLQGPNILGACALVIYLMVQVLLSADRSLLRRRQQRLLVAATLASCLLAQSRGATITLVAGMLVTSALRRRSIGDRYTRAVMLVAVAALFALFLPRTGVLARFESSDVADGGNSRSRIATAGIAVARQYPTTGIGKADFLEAAANLDLPVYGVPHNLFIYVAMRDGIPIAALLALAMVIEIRRAAAGLKRQDQRDEQGAPVTLTAPVVGVVSVFVMQMLYVSICFHPLAGLSGVLLGLCSGVASAPDSRSTAERSGAPA